MTEKLKLFFSPASPYVRKVMIAAAERGIADRIEKLPSAAGPVARDKTIVPHNPSGKVPSGILADGQPLFDSRVLCQWVDAEGVSGAPLYPASGPARFRVLTLEALADSILDACLLIRYESVIRPEALRWQDWLDGQMEKVESGLDDLESRWIGDLERGFDAGAIAVAAALGYLDFRFPAKDWRAGHPQLAAWFAEASKRASMADSFPQG